MMKCAFDGPDKAACLEARLALDNNPYISDPKQTFDRYHSWRRYALPWLMLIALTTVTSYVVYSWVIHQLSSTPATGSSTAPSLLNTTSPAAAPATTPPQNANSPAASASGSNAASRSTLNCCCKGRSAKGAWVIHPIRSLNLW